MAWTLLGGGAIVFALTGLNSEGPIGQKTTFHAVPGVLGAAMMVSSIPLFIASGRNKKKGMSLSFKNEITPQIQKNSFVNRSVPSLTLKISL